MNIVERYLNCLVNFEGVPNYMEMSEAKLYAIKLVLIKEGEIGDYYFIAKNTGGFTNSILGKKLMRDLMHKYEPNEVIVIDGEVMENQYHGSYMTMKSRIMDAIVKQIIVE